MALTKQQIEEFEELYQFYEDSPYSDPFKDLADEIAEAGDKAWANKLYKIAEGKAETFADLFGIGYSIIEKLGDMAWAKGVYKKAQRKAERPYDYESLAESIRVDLGDKKWAKKLKDTPITDKENEYQITIHGSGGEIIIGEIGRNRYLLQEENSNDLEKFIFGEHGDGNKVETIWGLSTEAKIEVTNENSEKSFDKTIYFKNLVAEHDIKYRQFRNQKYYFLGLSMNAGESLSCTINEEFDVARLRYKFYQFNSPQIADIFLTDVSYAPIDGREEIQFFSDGDTKHKGKLFSIFKGSECESEDNVESESKKKVVKKTTKKRAASKKRVAKKVTKDKRH